MDKTTRLNSKKKKKARASFYIYTNSNSTAKCLNFFVSSISLLIQLMSCQVWWRRWGSALVMSVQCLSCGLLREKLLQLKADQVRELLAVAVVMHVCLARRQGVVFVTTLFLLQSTRNLKTLLLLFFPFFFLCYVIYFQRQYSLFCLLQILLPRLFIRKRRRRHSASSSSLLDLLVQQGESQFPVLQETLEMPQHE